MEIISTGLADAALTAVVAQQGCENECAHQIPLREGLHNF
jgi:hypothetical protein